MSLPVVVANICSSCLKRSDLDETFCETVAAELSSAHPEIHWSVGTITCQRFCPSGRLTLSVQGPDSSEAILGMSRSASLDDTVKGILVRSLRSRS
jgi:hypothetical protein